MSSAFMVGQSPRANKSVSFGTGTGSPKASKKIFFDNFCEKRCE